MRCLGAENPPCQRCAKAGRKCIVLASRRGQQSANSRRRRDPATPELEVALHQQNTPSSARSLGRLSSDPLPPASAGALSVTYHLSPISHTTPGSTNQSGQIASPGLPSVFSSSPIDVLRPIGTQPPEPPIGSQSQPRSSDFIFTPRESYTGSLLPTRVSLHIADSTLVELVDL